MKALLLQQWQREKNLSRERTIGKCYTEINFAEDRHTNNLLNFFYTFLENIPFNLIHFMPQTFLNLIFLVENKVFQNCQNSHSGNPQAKIKGGKKIFFWCIKHKNTGFCQTWWQSWNLCNCHRKILFLSITLYFSSLNVILGPYQS